jgi:aminoglycoside/choline kinase family phosphotransferase
MAIAKTENALKDLTRDKLKQDFLKYNGFSEFDIDHLPADASFRTYARLIKGEESYILMDSPPEYYRLTPFINIANHLLKYDFSAPKIFHEDHENGFMILEDLGKVSINHFLLHNQAEEFEEHLYKKIIRLLNQIQKVELPANLELYTKELLVQEAGLFLDWFLPIFHGEAISLELRTEYNQLWNKILNSIPLENSCLTLRDFHVDNLMYIEDRDSFNQIGLLDFQDAIIGFPAYDLVSLLEDARRDINPSFANDMINYFISLNPTCNRKDFLAQYSILGAQRNLRILGVFARKATRDKNSKYLNLVPRVKKYLEKDLSHPLLAPLKEWLNKVTPQQNF